MRPLRILRLRRQRSRVREVSALGQLVERIVLRVQAPERPPERDPAKERQDRNRDVQPDQQRVRRQRHERLRDGRREGVREPEHTCHERTHVLRGFGVGVLETRDRGEDLREGDQQVGGGLHPDAEGRFDVAVAGELAAGRFDVDEVLDQGGDDHAEHGADEAALNFLEGRENDAHARELGVEELVEDGDEAVRFECQFGGLKG